MIAAAGAAVLTGIDAAAGKAAVAAQMVGAVGSQARHVDVLGAVNPRSYGGGASRMASPVIVGSVEGETATEGDSIIGSYHCYVGLLVREH